MTKYEEKQLFHSIDNMTHNLTTSIGEVVEVLGAIYAEIEKISIYMKEENEFDYQEFEEKNDEMCREFPELKKYLG